MQEGQEAVLPLEVKKDPGRAYRVICGPAAERQSC